MAWALRRFDSSPVPRRADVLETGNFGGDKLSGLPRHVGEPWRADVLCGETSEFGVRRFQPFLFQKRSGDEAVTSLVTSVFQNLAVLERFGTKNLVISLLSLLLALPAYVLPRCTTSSADCFSHYKTLACSMN